MSGRDVPLHAAQLRPTAPRWRRGRPLGAGIAGGVAATVTLLALVPSIGVAIALVGVAAALRRWPGAVIAISWNGFWLYLGALDLLDVSPRTATTVAAYAAVALVLAAFAWRRRGAIERRIGAASRPTRTWIVSAVLLGAWFALNVALLSGGSLAHRLLGVFVFATVPTVVAVAAADERELRQARVGLVVLGLVFVLIEFVAGARGTGSGARFSPIAELDPISASLVPAIGVVAAATFRFTTTRAVLLQVAALVALACGAALNGARGPIVALALAVVVTAIVALHRRGVVVVAATALGLMAGSIWVETLFAQPAAVSSLVSESAHIRHRSDSEPISSLSIRRQWLEKALRAIPDAPVVGNGVGTLVDDTPEAARMGVFGQRVYPHNDFVEAAYSLGAIGLVLFALLVLVPVVALWRSRSRLAHPHAAFVVCLFAFAFFESNFSGEIGTDLLLWSGAVLALLVHDAGPAGGEA